MGNRPEEPDFVSETIWIDKGFSKFDFKNPTVMTKISLSLHTIRIRKKRSEDYLSLSEFSPGLDLLDVLDEYFSNLTTTLSIDSGSKSILAIKHHTKRLRALKGIVRTGDYGYESDIVDPNDGAIKYTKSVNEAEVLPFFFMIYIPEGKDEGLLALQRFGNLGITNTLKLDVNKYFSGRDTLDGFKLEVKSLVPEDVITSLVDNGNITTVKFKKFGIQQDIADQYDGGGHKELQGYTELKIVAKNGMPFKSKVRAVLRGQRLASNMIELDDFRYDTVSITVNVNGESRTIQLDNLNSFKAYYNITDRVRLGPDGHPRFDAMALCAKEYINDAVNSIYPGEGLTI